MCWIYYSQKIGAAGMDSIPAVSPPSPVMPKNCLHPCCYGRGRDFCFPCYRNLMEKKA